jgi:hypothetical protein
MSQIRHIVDDPCRFRRHVAIVLGIALVVRFAVAAAFWPSCDLATQGDPRWMEETRRQPG